MAYSRITYNPDGRIYTIPFSYLNPAHIKVFIDITETTDFRFLNQQTIQLNFDPLNTITIKRETPKDEQLVDFQDAAILTEHDLDSNTLQTLFIMQELTDQYESTIGIDDDNKFNAQNRVIKNVATPTNSGDAVNKAYADQMLNQVNAAGTSHLNNINTAGTAHLNNIRTEGSLQVEAATTQAGIAIAKAEEATTQAEVATTKAWEASISATNAQNSANAAALAASSVDHSKLVPTGAIFHFATNVAPEGYIKANGALLSRVTYADLWNHAQASGNLVDEADWSNGKLGSYSTGDGSTTFRVPMLNGRTIIGAGQGGELTYREMGASGGEEKHKQTLNELVSHKHVLYLSTRPSASFVDGEPTGYYQSLDPNPNSSTTYAGGGQPFNIMQPYVALLACIKY